MRRKLVLFSGAPAPASGDFDFRPERNVLVKRADDLVRVENLNGSIGDDITGGNRACNTFLDLKSLRRICVKIKFDLFQVQDDLRNILGDIRQSRKLMGNAFDSYGRDSRPCEGNCLSYVQNRSERELQ